MNLRWIPIAGAALMLISGCQCCPLYNCYADAIDDISDTHVYFDGCYNPKFDISRMGRPDWCSPFNCFMCPAGCVNGCYNRYNDCYLYPPLYPFQFPSNVMPPPTVRTSRIIRPIDRDLDEPATGTTVDIPASGPLPEPSPDQ